MRLPPLFCALPCLLLAALAFQACGGNVVVDVGGSGSTGSGGGGEPNGFDSCTGPGQCVLMGTGCCDSCGQPSLASMAAVNSAQASAFFDSVCPVPTPCPACASSPEPNLFATCVQGTCRGADVRTDPVSACTTSADCTLRFGMDCCESCFADASQLVAVSTSSNLSTLLCGQSTACDDCLPQYPADAAAICNNGHCAVIFAGQGGG